MAHGAMGGTVPRSLRTRGADADIAPGLRDPQDLDPDGCPLRSVLAPCRRTWLQYAGRDVPERAGLPGGERGREGDLGGVDGPAQLSCAGSAYWAMRGPGICRGGPGSGTAPLGGGGKPKQL